MSYLVMAFWVTVSTLGFFTLGIMITIIRELKNAVVEMAEQERKKTREEQEKKKD